MAKYPAPLPLFDTLESLKSSSTCPDKNFVFGTQDYSLARNFLLIYDGNQQTFTAYRREIERLLQWSWRIAQKSILSLSRQDIENYIYFCMTPPKSWIGLKNVSRFIIKDGARIANPEWKPFVAKITKAQFKKGNTPDKSLYHPSRKSIQEIFTVLNSFFNHLVLEEKILTNPIALIKQKSKFIQKQQSHSPVRRLSDKQWETVISITQQLAIEEPEKYARTLFMLSAFYLMYLRISELVASHRWIPKMGDFYCDSGQKWWFKTVGKGNKERNIAVSDNMLDALKAWRSYLGLSPALPSPGDEAPLMPKNKGQGAITSAYPIRQSIQHCFDQAVLHLKKQNLIEEAQQLEEATIHWLRHTGISVDLNTHKRPAVHVRDDAGHASIATTDRYNDATLQERYDSAKNKLLK